MGIGSLSRYLNRRNFVTTCKRSVPASLKKVVASEQKWNCAICLKILDYTYQIDHILPLSQGGDNRRSNLQALCPNCHAKKTYLESIKPSYFDQDPEDRHSPLSLEDP